MLRTAGKEGARREVFAEPLGQLYRAATRKAAAAKARHKQKAKGRGQKAKLKLRDARDSFLCCE